MESSLIKNKYDGMGIILSCACILHCLALPILTYLAPSITVFFEQEWMHITLLILLIPIALFTFVRGRKIHSNNKPLIFGLAGISSLLLAILFEGLTKFQLETILTFLGSTALIIAHWINIKSMNN